MTFEQHSIVVLNFPPSTQKDIESITESCESIYNFEVMGKEAILVGSLTAFGWLLIFTAALQVLRKHQHHMQGQMRRLVKAYFIILSVTILLIVISTAIGAFIRH